MIARTLLGLLVGLLNAYIFFLVTLLYRAVLVTFGDPTSGSVLDFFQAAVANPKYLFPPLTLHPATLFYWTPELLILYSFLFFNPLAYSRDDSRPLFHLFVRAPLRWTLRTQRVFLLLFGIPLVVYHLILFFQTGEAFSLAPPYAASRFASIAALITLPVLVLLFLVFSDISSLTRQPEPQRDTYLRRGTNVLDEGTNISRTLLDRQARRLRTKFQKPDNE